MKRKLAIMASVGLAAGIIGGCDGHGDGDVVAGNQSSPTTPAAPAAPVSQSLDTAQVLALAQKPSQTDAPFAVDSRLLTLNDTSDSSTPITVNGM